MHMCLAASTLKKKNTVMNKFIGLFTDFLIGVTSPNTLRSLQKNLYLRECVTICDKSLYGLEVISIGLHVLGCINTGRLLEFLLFQSNLVKWPIDCLAG